MKGERRGCSSWIFFIFRERRCSFSLDFWLIRPSDFVGPRRKVVLRSEDFAWTLVLGSFDKLREVGVYPTCFTPCLNALLMIRLF